MSKKFFEALDRKLSEALSRNLPLLESRKFKKGNTFKFGVWEGKPIEWQVLSTRGGIFCISKYCLEKRRFEDDEDFNCWEDSELKHWLNSDFLNNAFNSEEKSFLMPFKGDKVTLLSIEEVKKYLPTESERKATDRKGIRAWWWLNLCPKHSLTVAVVNGSGNIAYKDGRIASGSVRPTIILKEDVKKFLEPEA